MIQPEFDYIDKALLRFWAAMLFVNIIIIVMTIWVVFT